jgi:hypothetical protein
LDYTAGCQDSAIEGQEGQEVNLDLPHPIDGIFDSGSFGTIFSEYLGFSSLVLHFVCFTTGTISSGEG